MGGKQSSKKPISIVKDGRSGLSGRKSLPEFKTTEKKVAGEL